MTALQCAAPVSARRPSTPTLVRRRPGTTPTPRDVADRPARRLVGTAGRAITDLAVVVTAIQPVQAALGPGFKITLETRDGRRLVWYRQRPFSLRPGDAVTITRARVKSHRTGGPRPATLLTNICLLEKEKLQAAAG